MSDDKIVSRCYNIHCLRSFYKFFLKAIICKKCEFGVYYGIVIYDTVEIIVRNCR